MSSRRNCTFFLRGNCNRGESCPFSHPGSQTSKTLDVTTSLAPCRFYQKGSCTKGGTCPFAHVDAPKPCHFFQSGVCSKGDSCTFAHTPPVIAPGTSNETPSVVSVPGWRIPGRSPRGPTPPIQFECPPIPSFSPKSLTPQRPCAYFHAGICIYGSSCSFSHDTPRPLPQQLENTLVTTAPCIFFQNGICAKGAKCPYSHDRVDIPLDPISAAAPHRRNSMDPSETNATKPIPIPEFSGPITHTTPSCTVVIEDGLSIRRIITALESTRLFINNLPPTINEDKVGELLSVFAPVMECSIVPPSASTMERTGAIVDFENPDDAAQAVKSLDDTDYDGYNIIARLELPPCGDAGALRDSSVKVTWFAPVSIAYAHFPSSRQARNCAGILNKTAFRNRIIESKFQTPTPRQRHSFTVIISNLPVNLGEEEEVVLRNLTKCGDITFHRPKYMLDNATPILHRKLNVDGHLEAFDIITATLNQYKITAIARYSSAASAKQAVDSLNGSRMDCLGDGPLWLSHMVSIKFNLPRPQYVAVKSQFNFQRQLLQMKEADVRWAVYDEVPSGNLADKVVIRISGEDPKSLGRVKARLETILLGEVLEVDGVKLWDDHLLTKNGDVSLVSLASGAGAYLRCDSRRHHISLYGTPETRDAARSLVLRELNSLRQRRHLIPLKAGIFGRVVRTGLASLRAQYGAEAIILDVVSRQLIVQVNPHQLRAIDATLQIMEMNSIPMTLSGDADCPVCTCEVEQPVSLSCGHKYCAGCMDSWVESLSSFPMICLVKDCNEAVSLAIIQERLPASQRDNLFEKACKAYLDTHPNDFKYCPTPDCAQIYRPGEEGTTIQCRSCLAHTCSACHVEAHDGFTCAERREESDPAEREYRKWKKENDVKQCPNCRMDIQKSMGCNHMTCTRCKTHICWVCMKTFPGGAGIYDHMRQAHGGIGI